jgi:glycosyltransferase involved in cell wall biosynthesis
MKVIKIIPSLGFGGIETVFEITARYYQGSKDDLVFLAMGGGGTAAKVITEAGFRVVLWNMPTRIPNWKLIPKLVKFIKQEKPDVVHTTGAEANFHGLIAARICGVPVRVGEEIGMPVHSRMARIAFRMVYGVSSSVIAVAGQVADFLRDTKEAPEHKIAMIYNPVDFRIFGVNKNDPEQGRFRMVSICRHTPPKNLDVMIRAAAALRKRAPDLNMELWVVGDGPSRPGLEELAASLDLGDSVKFWGFQEQRVEFLKKATLFVLPSYSEGHPISVLEAMMMETPCIVTNGGGVPEIIEEGKTGWMMDPHDLEGFTDKLEHIARLPDAERREVGRLAGVNIRAHFPPDLYMERIWALYRRIHPQAV